MRYGFVIDQDRCIGCHACTVACKEEHQVPLGVFRTWVKYIEKGESEGKSLLDAMRDGSNDGMQHFDAEIEKFIRGGVIDVDTGLAYATNGGNLRLELTDFIEGQQRRRPCLAQQTASTSDPDSEFEFIR